MVTNFKNRFGSQVAIIHSRLSMGEKYDEWRKIENKEVSIAIGARSAVFAPFNNLGIIIMMKSTRLLINKKIHLDIILLMLLYIEPESIIVQLF